MPDANTSRVRRSDRVISKTSIGGCLLFGSYLLFWIWSYYLSLQFHNADIASVSFATGLKSSITPNDQQNDNPPLASNITTEIAGTFVMQVRGEMGNNLQKIAHGHALRWYAQDEYGFSPQLLMRHKKKTKWMTARQDVYQCFPRLRSLDYESGLSPTFTRIQRDHLSWLEKQPAEWTEKLFLVKEDFHSNITQGLHAMKQLTMVRPKPYSEYPIVVLGGPMRNAIIDKYYQRFRDELFVFDNGNDCCAQFPDPDEVVFHFRHFAKELSAEEQKSRGFEELDPQRVATQLMGHLQPGQRIAITTRFANEPIVDKYVGAMKRQGFHVRVVANQTGVQDFCFLLRAKQELLGVAKSTYARWAAYLGDADRVQLYALDNAGSKEFIQQTMLFTWTNAELTRRIQFPVFASLDTR